ncbi:hypothetical protein HELRODRAFT_175666 [Helobdella robusta]|uniref:Uncharacterized protein n=1 Tax=Helobdella robusta TaxID=6412 RepID=T1F9H7_HELRO|nr:hypothetical protein HELRODRAFT_175666 [Helobdella robusta]ESO00683.1 hypothetical protein HELRODRAFT_175666 [Helobdella robusta]
MSDKSSNNSNIACLPPKGQTTPTLTTTASSIPPNISKLTKIRNSSFEGSTINQQGQDQLSLTSTSRHHSDYDLRNQEQDFNNRIADNSMLLQQQQQQQQLHRQHGNSVVSKMTSDSRRSSVDSFYPTTTMLPIVSSPMQYININNMKTSNMTSKSALPPTPRQPITKYRKSYSLSSSFGRLLKPFKEDQRFVPGNFKHLDKKSKNIDKTIKQPMMNGGTCEKVTKYDPLQPLPYKDLSRFDDDSDGVYMCWTASTLTDLQNKFNNPAKKVDYINLMSNDDNKQSKSFPLKLKTNASDFLKPNYSSDSINHLSTMFYAKNSLPQPQNQQNESNTNKNSYVNFNNASEKVIPQRLNNKKLVHSHSDVTAPISQRSPKTDKCKVSKTETADNSNYITMQQLGINMFGEAPQPAPSLQTESTSSTPSASKEKMKNVDSVIGEDVNKINKQSILTNYSSDANDYFEKNCEDKLMVLEQNSHVSFSDEEVEQGANKNVKQAPAKLPQSNDDLLREQLMKSPPPPTPCLFFPLQSPSLQPPTTPSAEQQDYINLSTMTSAVLPPPPPLPPKTLPIIKEDVQQESSSSNPPPIPAKSKHVRNNSYERNMSQANSTIITKHEIFPLIQSEPKPPIPKRQIYSNSPGATYNQPSSNTLPFHHGKSSSVSSLSNMPLSFVRPVSASVGITKHRKPNLTVQIDGTVEEESIPVGRKLSGFSDVNSTASGNSYRHRKSSDMNESMVGNKRSSFDASRSTTSLATSKPRNGREYLDRRRLVESPQQSPSIASTIFSFDEKSVANNCSSGEDSPRFSSGIISVGRSSLRMSQELMRRVPLTPHECLQHDSPIPDSPGNSSVRTRTSNNTLVNYADIDVLSMESSIEQPQSAKGFKIPPSTPSPHDKTVYATIDLMATVAATQVGKQHAKQRENTLEKHGDVSRNKVNGMSNIIERGRLSLDPKRYPSSIAKE